MGKEKSDGKEGEKLVFITFVDF